MTPYTYFIEQLVNLFEAAQQYQRGGFRFPPTPDISTSAPVAIILSPHPDDECIVGGLPLRLLRELKFRVVNVPVTLGSNPERQLERFDELTNACKFLGFELLPIQERGLIHITPHGRKFDRANWHNAVVSVANILTSEQPMMMIYPHINDGHPTHQGASLLAVDALARMPREFTCYIVETEYWRPMDSPNTLVEIGNQDLSDLVTALSFHIGEVERNPYHLSLPAWMIDNVRRGSELIGGFGETLEEPMFAIIYKLRKWSKGRMVDLLDSRRIISTAADLSQMLA